MATSHDDDESDPNFPHEDDVMPVAEWLQVLPKQDRLASLTRIRERLARERALVEGLLRRYEQDGQGEAALMAQRRDVQALEEAMRHLEYQGDKLN